MQAVQIAYSWQMTRCPCLQTSLFVRAFSCKVKKPTHSPVVPLQKEQVFAAGDSQLHPAQFHTDQSSHHAPRCQNLQKKWPAMFIASVLAQTTSMQWCYNLSNNKCWWRQMHADPALQFCCLHHDRSLTIKSTQRYVGLTNMLQSMHQQSIRCAK